MVTSENIHGGGKTTRTRKQRLNNNNNIDKNLQTLEGGDRGGPTTKAKRAQYCTICKNHNEEVLKKRHKCPFSECQCELCQLSRRVQLTMRHQQRLWRFRKTIGKCGTSSSQAPSPTTSGSPASSVCSGKGDCRLQESLVDDPIQMADVASTITTTTTTTTTTAAITTTITGKERLKAEKAGKQQVCDKCRNHDFWVLKRGHKGKCPFDTCTCRYCVFTIKRRDLMKLQQRVRRAHVVSQKTTDSTDYAIQPAKTPLKRDDTNGCPVVEETMESSSSGMSPGGQKEEVLLQDNSQFTIDEQQVSWQRCSTENITPRLSPEMSHPPNADSELSHRQSRDSTSNHQQAIDSNQFQQQETEPIQVNAGCDSFHQQKRDTRPLQQRSRDTIAFQTPNRETMHPQQPMIETVTFKRPPRETISYQEEPENSEPFQQSNRSPSTPNQAPRELMHYHQSSDDSLTFQQTNRESISFQQVNKDSVPYQQRIKTFMTFQHLNTESTTYLHPNRNAITFQQSNMNSTYFQNSHHVNQSPEYHPNNTDVPMHSPIKHMEMEPSAENGLMYDGNEDLEPPRDFTTPVQDYSLRRTYDTEANMLHAPKFGVHPEDLMLRHWSTNDAEEVSSSLPQNGNNFSEASLSIQLHQAHQMEIPRPQPHHQIHHQSTHHPVQPASPSSFEHDAGSYMAGWTSSPVRYSSGEFSRNHFNSMQLNVCEAFVPNSESHTQRTWWQRARMASLERTNSG